MTYTQGVILRIQIARNTFTMCYELSVSFCFLYPNLFYHINQVLIYGNLVYKSLDKFAWNK